MPATSLRRLIVAAVLALMAHAALLYLADRTNRRAARPVDTPASLRIQLRISSPQTARTPLKLAPHATPETESPRVQAKRSIEARSTGPAKRPAESAETAPVPALVEPSRPPSNSLSLDSSQVMQQVLQADRQRRAQRQTPLWAAHAHIGEHGASSPFDALGGGDQATVQIKSATDNRGTRVEKITTLRGSYCVTTPNGATAYRHENGLNLSGAGNCPR